MAAQDSQPLPARAGDVAADEASAAPRVALSAERAIALCRRWLLWSSLFNAAMVGLVTAAAIYGFSNGMGAGPALMAGVLWFGVLVVSVRARRLAFEAMPMIVAGDFARAEDQLGESLRSFSLLRSTKLLGLQQLALLRHAQARWSDAAQLCRELLARRRGTSDVAAEAAAAEAGRAGGSFEVQSRLMLAESLLELGDTAGAGAELLGLASMRLDLRETLVLTHVRLDLQARLGHWAAMMADPPATLGLVELMPTATNARCHALLALAALRLGRGDWHALLVRRATLMMDVDRILEGRPFLRDAFA